MTPKERAAMQQACQTPLKDLLRGVPKDGRDCYEESPTHHHFIPYGRLIHEALAEIERLEAALEQPVTDTELINANCRYTTPLMNEQPVSQEPVAWFVQYKNRHEFVFGSKPEFIVDGVVEPLYAAPVRTKDLTDDEIAQAVGSPLDEVYLADFRAVIAADREKNK